MEGTLWVHPGSLFGVRVPLPLQIFQLLLPLTFLPPPLLPTALWPPRGLYPCYHKHF